MANFKLPGPLGNTCIVPDDQTLALTQMFSPGIPINAEMSDAELDRKKYELTKDIAQLILDLVGIFEPTPFAYSGQSDQSFWF